MNTGRRSLLKQVAAMAGTTMLNSTAGIASPAQTQSALDQVPVELQGMDLYAVYRKMFSSTADDAVCCWWYLGTSRTDVPDIGQVATSQVETCMIYKTQNVGADSVKVSWKEIGVFRDIATGELPGPWLNPETGKTEPRRASLEDGPAHYTVSRRSGGVHIDLDQAHARVQAVVARFSVKDGQVCITQTEDKIRQVDTPKPLPIRTVLKIYASLADLQVPGAASVKASGFYYAGATDPAIKGFSVNGLMQKAAVDEKLNPVGWERMRVAYPAFFKGNRVDPSWS